MDTKHWLSLGIILSCLLIVGVTTSFAYFTANITKENENKTKVEAGRIGSIKYDGELTFNETNIYPGMQNIQTFTIEKGSQEGTGTYEIDLASTLPEVFGSDIEITLYKTTTPETDNVTRKEGSLTQTAEGFIKEDEIIINGSPEIVYGPETLTNSSEIILEQADFDTSTLAKTTYYLVYNYKNNGNQNAQQGQTFSGKVTVKLIAEKTPSIVDQIISQLDTTGKCPTVNDDGTVVINSEEETDGYVCSAPDDYGTSYYFRGNVENNWVKFANSYWRIIRINGDNTIRMIYAGNANVIDSLENKEEVLKNGYNDGDTDYAQIGTSAFNSSYDDNAHVGYMYGTIGASTYEETHANTNNSTIKIKVDEWYETHLKGTEYESYLSDTLFCNDRSFDETYNSGTGAGTSQTDYRPSSPYIGNKTLKCTQKNDRFTVDNEEIGNGSLTYPISLITIDEVYLAGGYGSTNSSYYLYTGNYYWTLSPSSFGGSYAGVHSVGDGGNSNSYDVRSSYGVRPVINLKAGSLKTGSGTALDPYQV